MLLNYNKLKPKYLSSFRKSWLWNPCSYTDVSMASISSRFGPFRNWDSFYTILLDLEMKLSKMNTNEYNKFQPSVTDTASLQCCGFSFIKAECFYSRASSSWYKWYICTNFFLSLLNHNEERNPTLVPYLVWTAQLLVFLGRSALWRGHIRCQFPLLPVGCF